MTVVAACVRTSTVATRRLPEILYDEFRRLCATVLARFREMPIPWINRLLVLCHEMSASDPERGMLASRHICATIRCGRRRSLQTPRPWGFRRTALQQWDICLRINLKRRRDHRHDQLLPFSAASRCSSRSSAPVNFVPDVTTSSRYQPFRRPGILERSRRCRCGRAVG